MFDDADLDFVAAAHESQYHMLDDADLDFVDAAQESQYHMLDDADLDFVAAETQAVLESSQHQQQLVGIDL